MHNYTHFDFTSTENSFNKGKKIFQISLQPNTVSRLSSNCGSCLNFAFYSFRTDNLSLPRLRTDLAKISSFPMPLLTFIVSPSNLPEWSVRTRREKATLLSNFLHLHKAQTCLTESHVKVSAHHGLTLHMKEKIDSVHLSPYAIERIHLCHLLNIYEQRRRKMHWGSYIKMLPIFISSVLRCFNEKSACLNLFRSGRCALFISESK